MIIIKNIRTEQEVLKDFEKIEYKIKINNKYKTITLSKRNVRIKIYKDGFCYQKYYENSDCSRSNTIITLTEHKLLNELFTIWRWL